MTIIAFATHDKRLLQDVYSTISETIKERGNKWSQLRFARQARNGWSFFTNKEIAWDTIEVITKKIADMHYNCCGHLRTAEFVSEIVNMTRGQLDSLRAAF